MSVGVGTRALKAVLVKLAAFEPARTTGRHGSVHNLPSRALLTEGMPWKLWPTQACHADELLMQQADAQQAQQENTTRWVLGQLTNLRHC